MMKIFLLMSLMVLGFSSNVCGQETKLPKELPKSVLILFQKIGGKSGAQEKIKIQSGTLKFEKKDGNISKDESWSRKLASEDLSKLYQIFVENEFETVKNDKAEGMVYDAPSQTISIEYDAGNKISVRFGATSPLSGKNLTRYRNVRQAILDLVEKYRKSQ